MTEDVLKKCPAPTALDKHTLQVYAEQCGKEIALQWVADETGVAVGSCAKEEVKDIPECIAGNYSIDLDLVDKDGNIKWDNVVHDAGAVGGIVVCAATGAGAAALPICGKIGGALADATYALAKGAYEVGSKILSVFFGGDEKFGTACNFKYVLPTPLYAAKLTAKFLKSPITLAPVPPSEVVGDQVLGTNGAIDAFTTDVDHARYWSRILLFRGLAAASAAVADSMARETGASFAEALRVLNPVAPKSWIELVRPAVRPIVQDPKAAEYSDYVMNIGGLLSCVLQPNAFWTYSRQPKHGQLIVPRWQEPDAWGGVPTAFPVRWYTLMFVIACDYDTAAWARVADGVKAEARIRALPAAVSAGKSDGPAGRSHWQTYWLYSIPEDIDNFARQTPDDGFKALLAAWQLSLHKDMKKKLDRLKASRVSAPTSSTTTTLVKAGAGAGILWAILKYFKVM
jgi:hypothetical protein